MERQTDFLDAMDSMAVQVVSTLRLEHAERVPRPVRAPAPEFVGQRRFGHRRRTSRSRRRRSSAARVGATGQAGAGFDFKQNIWQVIDNFTMVKGQPQRKFGFDWQFIHDERTNGTAVQIYTFPTVAATRRRRAAPTRSRYTTLQQVTRAAVLRHGHERREASSSRTTGRSPSNLKFLYGVRYDLYQYPPDGRSDAPLDASQTFNIDKNNFGPRVGVAWTLNERSVVRASTGLMYDQPMLLGGYEQALQFNGSPLSYTVSLQPDQRRGAGLPGNLSSPPPGFTLPVQSLCDGRSRLPGRRARGRTTCSTSTRSAATSRSRSGYMYAKDQRPARGDRRQPDQPGRLAGRRASDLLHGGERGHAARTRVSTTSTRCSRSAPVTTTR